MKGNAMDMQKYMLLSSLVAAENALRVAVLALVYFGGDGLGGERASVMDKVADTIHLWIEMIEEGLE
jgi:hypothetical protein